jgi:hypothetical protein
VRGGWRLLVMVTQPATAWKKKTEAGGGAINRYHSNNNNFNFFHFNYFHFDNYYIYLY